MPSLVDIWCVVLHRKEIEEKIILKNFLNFLKILLILFPFSELCSVCSRFAQMTLENDYFLAGKSSVFRSWYTSDFNQLEPQEIQAVKRTLCSALAHCCIEIQSRFSSQLATHPFTLHPFNFISLLHLQNVPLIFHLYSIFTLFYLILLSIQTLHSSCQEPRPPHLHARIRLAAQLPEGMCAGLQHWCVREGKIPFCSFTGSYNHSLLGHTPVRVCSLSWSKSSHTPQHEAENIAFLVLNLAARGSDKDMMFSAFKEVWMLL